MLTNLFSYLRTPYTDSQKSGKPLSKTTPSETDKPDKFITSDYQDFANQFPMPCTFPSSPDDSFKKTNSPSQPIPILKNHNSKNKNDSDNDPMLLHKKRTNKVRFHELDQHGVEDDSDNESMIVNVPCYNNTHFQQINYDVLSTASTVDSSNDYQQKSNLKDVDIFNVELEKAQIEHATALQQQKNILHLLLRIDNPTLIDIKAASKAIWPNLTFSQKALLEYSKLDQSPKDFLPFLSADIESNSKKRQILKQLTELLQIKQLLSSHQA